MKQELQRMYKIGRIVCIYSCNSFNDRPCDLDNVKLLEEVMVYYSDISLEGLRNCTKHLSQDGRWEHHRNES